MQTCPFCSASIDPAAAAAAALRNSPVGPSSLQRRQLFEDHGRLRRDLLLPEDLVTGSDYLLLAIVALWFLEAAIPADDDPLVGKVRRTPQDRRSGFCPRPAHRAACGSRGRSLPLSYRNRRIPRRYRRISFLVQRRMLEADSRPAHWPHPNHNSGRPITPRP